MLVARKGAALVRRGGASKCGGPGDANRAQRKGVFHVSIDVWHSRFSAQQRMAVMLRHMGGDAPLASVRASLCCLMHMHMRGQAWLWLSMMR